MGVLNIQSVIFYKQNIYICLQQMYLSLNFNLNITFFKYMYKKYTKYDTNSNKVDPLFISAVNAVECNKTMINTGYHP